VSFKKEGMFISIHLDSTILFLGICKREMLLAKSEIKSKTITQLAAVNATLLVSV
jgi:hypothetical protein